MTTLNKQYTYLIFGFLITCTNWTGEMVASHSCISFSSTPSKFPENKTEHSG
jgi:hypothetical protein